MAIAATRCDECDTPSRLYTEWPVCRECGGYYCPSCSIDPKSGEGERHDSCLCKECAE